MTWIIDKFAEMVDNDTYTEITGQEAKEIITHEIESMGELPSYVLDGDIVAFRSLWTAYRQEELKDEFDYLLDGDEELNGLIKKLQEQTQILHLSNGKYAIAAEF